MSRKKTRQQVLCRFCKAEFEYLPGHTKGFYCSQNCRIHGQVHEKLERDKKLFEAGKLKYRARIRIFVLERDKHRCAVCRLSSWLDQPITLWLDHIDGNASNNAPTNFRLVCPNCDSQSTTFGGKNRGSGRRSLGLKPWE